MVLNKGLRVTRIALLAQAAAFCVPVPAARSQDRHPASPRVATARRIARPSPPGVADGTGGRGFSPAGVGEPSWRARVPGEGKTQIL
jgi:hypothetical protein